MDHGEVREIPLLREVLEVQSHSRQTTRMAQYLARKAYALGADIVEAHNGNMYITKGNTKWFPCIVAHTDTVHHIVPDDEYKVEFHNGAYFAWNPKKKIEQGVGGDDKVGIYIALAALRDFEHVKVALFRDEEIGCLGAQAAKQDFFKDVRYILECDRRGNSDFVDNIGGPLQSKAFKNAVRPLLDKHGYKFSHGMMTDVDELKDIVPVCMANMSCGYYNPHTAKEFVDVVDVERARALVYDIFRTLDDKRWDHVVRGKFRSFSGYSDWGDDWEYGDWGRGSWNSHTHPAIPSRVESSLPKVPKEIESDSIIRIIETPDLPMSHTLPGVQDERGVIFDKTDDVDGPGAYEVFGYFDVFVEPEEASVRAQAQLPSHIAIKIMDPDDSMITITVEIQLGVDVFDSRDEAEKWGDKEARMLGEKYPIYPTDVRAFRTASNNYMRPLPY